MEDPHVHVDKTALPGFTNAAMRDLLASELGITSDLPKTVGTGCGRRRPIARTSTIPESVTCLACREYARDQRIRAAETAESVIPLLAEDPRFAAENGLAEELLQNQARQHRDLAGRFAPGCDSQCSRQEYLAREGDCTMPRLMAVSLTEQQVRDRSKTVTRRTGWRMLRPGDHLTLCKKVMGRRHGEPLDRIATVEVTAVHRERLDAIPAADVAAEGFPQMTPAEFVRFFCSTHRGCEPGTEITRIEWRYLD